MIGNDVKVVIAGSREITNYSELIRAIEDSKFEITAVVSGTARGVDRMGERFAVENNLEVLPYPANWDKYGKRAGYLRNSEMADVSDAAIILWDGESKGTKMMIEEMKKRKKPVYVRIVKE